jgi:cytochrome c-type biogenesis protein CcmE
MGQVVGTPSGDAHANGKRFRLRDVKGTTTVTVVYKGSVPDLFKTGNDVVVDGRLRNGVFIAVPDTLVTKCPSKYAPKR